MPSKKRKLGSRRRQKLRTATRRRLQRQEQNAMAAAAAQDSAQEQANPVPARARHITQLRLLLTRKTISPRQYRAGDQLYRDWRASGSEPRVVARYDRTVGGPVTSGADVQAAARTAVTRALRSLGEELADLAVHVCLLDQPLAHWSRMASTRKASLLSQALSRLAEFYRIGSSDDPAMRPSFPSAAAA